MSSTLSIQKEELLASKKKIRNSYDSIVEDFKNYNSIVAKAAEESKEPNLGVIAQRCNEALAALEAVGAEFETVEKAVESAVRTTEEAQEALSGLV